MKYGLSSLFVLLLFLIAFKAFAPDEIQKLALISPQLMSFDKEGSQYKILLFTSAKCPCTNRVLTHITQLMNQENVSYRIVDTSGFKEDVLVKYYSHFGVPGASIVLDKELQLAEKLNIEATPQVVIFDSNNRKIYSGLVIDENFQDVSLSKNIFMDAIQEHKKNGKLSHSYQVPMGCSLFPGSLSI